MILLCKRLVEMLVESLFLGICKKYICKNLVFSGNLLIFAAQGKIRMLKDKRLCL